MPFKGVTASTSPTMSVGIALGSSKKLLSACSSNLITKLTLKLNEIRDLD